MANNGDKKSGELARVVAQARGLVDSWPLGSRTRDDGQLTRAEELANLVLPHLDPEGTTRKARTIS